MKKSSAILIFLIILFKIHGQHAQVIQSGSEQFNKLTAQNNGILLPKDQPIYLYCNTGYRSEKTAEILIENGYTYVYNLQHGIMEWELLNLP